MWPDAEEEIIGGDMTAVLGYVTPAAGVVLTPVAPIGLRDRAAGTVGFTTSLGFGRKLDRIRENPRVALAYHAREHGFASSPRVVLVQGTAAYDSDPNPKILAEQVQPASAQFMGPPRTGVFWDRWLSAYYGDRVLVTVAVDRLISWPDLACREEPSVYGAPLAFEDPEPQQPPRKGVGPRVEIEPAARRVDKLPHVLLGFVGTDGFPVVMPVRVRESLPSGLRLEGPALPPGGRRAGLLAHRYERQLIGLECRQYTGWLQDGVYAPHTEGGFRAPANKTLLLLANGYMARRGLRRARAIGRA